MVSAEMLGEAARNRDSKPIIDGILELLFASGVPFRCLHRSVPRQKLNLFQFNLHTHDKAGRMFNEGRGVRDRLCRRHGIS